MTSASGMRDRQQEVVATFQGELVFPITLPEAIGQAAHATAFSAACCSSVYGTTPTIRFPHGIILSLRMPQRSATIYFVRSLTMTIWTP